MKTNPIPTWVPDHIREKFESNSESLMESESQIFYRLISDPRMEVVYWALENYSQDEQLRFILSAMTSARDSESYQAVSIKDIKADLQTIAKTAKKLAKEIGRLQKTGVELPIQFTSPWSLLPTNYPIKIKVKDQQKIEKKLKQKLEFETSPLLVRNRKDDPSLVEVIEKIYQAADKASGMKPEFLWESEVGVTIPNKKLNKDVLRKFLFVRELGEYTHSVFKSPSYKIITITAMVALDLNDDLSEEQVRGILRGGK